MMLFLSAHRHRALAGTLKRRQFNVTQLMSRWSRLERGCLSTTPCGHSADLRRVWHDAPLSRILTTDTNGSKCPYTQQYR